jgi:hypothetical protein
MPPLPSSVNSASEAGPAVARHAGELARRRAVRGAEGPAPHAARPPRRRGERLRLTRRELEARAVQRGRTGAGQDPRPHRVRAVVGGDERSGPSACMVNGLADPKSTQHLLTHAALHSD